MIAPKQNPFSLYDFLGYVVPGAIFLYALLLLPAITEPAAWPTPGLWNKLDLDRLQLYIPFLLASYLLGHVLSFLSSITVEKYAVWEFGYPSKYLLGVRHAGYWTVDQPVAVRRIVRALVWILLLPVTFSDLVFGHLLRLRELYTRPLDDLLIKILRDKVEALVTTRTSVKNLAEHGSAREHDFFRLVYHYAVEHAPAHLPKMQNYVALYGFLRTTCMIFVALFWVAVGLLVAGALTRPTAAVALSALSLAAFVLFMGFMKFYRRFSLEALMALSAVFVP